MLRISRLYNKSMYHARAHGYINISQRYSLDVCPLPRAWGTAEMSRFPSEISRTKSRGFPVTAWGSSADIGLSLSFRAGLRDFLTFAATEQRRACDDTCVLSPRRHEAGTSIRFALLAQPFSPPLAMKRGTSAPARCCATRRTFYV